MQQTHLSHILRLLFLLITAAFQAQTPSFNFLKLGSEEGLTNANIFNIEQHANGLVYFTTQNGIYYYDGYNFSKLDIDSLKSNALINASIKNEDELYLSLRDEGIATFNLRTRKYALHPSLKIKTNNADNIIVTDSYAFLLTREIKLVIVDMKTGKVLPDKIRNREKNRINLANCIYKTRSGEVLVGRSDGLYNATTGTEQKLDWAGDAPVYSITEDKQGRLLMGTTEKIHIFVNKKLQTEIIPTYKEKSSTFMLGGEKPIKKILCDDFGRIWFTSYPEENLFLYEHNNVYDVFEILGIPPSLVNCIYKDNLQNIWIGTYSESVYFIQNSFFNSLNFSFNGKNLNINQVFLKNNLLVAATNNGLYGLNVTNNKTRILSKPDEMIMEPVNSITFYNDVFYYSKRSQLYTSPTMFFDSKTTYKFKPIIARQYYPMSDDRSIVADWDLNILLCNGDATKTLDTLIFFTDYRISVNALLKEGDLLYIGTSNGLFIYDFKSDKYKNVVSPELNYNINDLAVINGKLYAAHEGGLTDIYSKKIIQELGEFRLNAVKKIKQYNNQIWLATLDGVFICDKSLKPIKTINKSNGLLSNSINDIAFNDQTISIATARGVSTTDFTNILKYNSALRPVTINYLSSNGKTFHSPNNTFQLGPGEENISVHFYSPRFSKPNKQYFKWRINDEEWKYFNTLYFDVILPGGQHKIEISASADNIVWSESTVLNINKEEKLSEKQLLYWLITFGGLIVITFISLIWIRRVQLRAKKRLQDEQQVNLLKHQAMNSLLSPHFIFNSLTSIQNYINTNNGLRASEYLAKFSRLIRMIIEKAAQSDITLHDELSRLTYYLELEKERFKNKFDYVIEIDENINTHEILIPNMIIQPYVENCIIHGILPKHEHGELKLVFKQMPNRKFLITIEDNGIGLIKAREHAKTGHKSLGTSTIQSILEINSKLTGRSQKVTMVDKSTLDENSTGTLITLELEL